MATNFHARERSVRLVCRAVSRPRERIVRRGPDGADDLASPARPPAHPSVRLGARTGAVDRGGPPGDSSSTPPEDRDPRRPTADTDCVSLDDPAFLRSDPLLYSQRQLLARGLAVTWTTPTSCC